jgi:hypothetical protein
VQGGRVDNIMGGGEGYEALGGMTGFSSLVDGFVSSLLPFFRFFSLFFSFSAFSSSFSSASVSSTVSIAQLEANYGDLEKGNEEQQKKAVQRMLPPPLCFVFISLFFSISVFFIIFLLLFTFLLPLFLFLPLFVCRKTER